MGNYNYLGIHHCEILVTDMDAALKFYIGIVGMEEITNSSSFLESKWLKLGNQQLHLTYHPISDANEERHFAVLVQDINQARTHFKNKSLLIKEAGSILGMERFFIFDPFGNRIEFVEIGLN